MRNFLILIFLAIQATQSYKHGIKKLTAMLQKKKDDLSDDAKSADM